MYLPFPDTPRILRIGVWEGPRTAMDTSETRYRGISYPAESGNSFSIVQPWCLVTTPTDLPSIILVRESRGNNWMPKVKPKAYTDIYVNTQQLLLNTTLFCNVQNKVVLSNNCCVLT